MARLSSDAKHCMIGAATCVALAAFFVLGYMGQPESRGSDGYRVFAYYESAAGLSVGSRVLMAGLPIGNVQSMRLDTDTNEVIVEMTIRDGYEIPVDSEASIISDGLAGGKYIRVVPGGDYEMLPPDGAFDYTRNSISFFDLFEKIILMAEARRDSQEAPAE
ncbi:MAG: MlaD family protein [Alphaproteobacteria bacterium]|nr:MlaD family protein [Alphaproteobacteria bacterium]